MKENYQRDTKALKEKAPGWGWHLLPIVGGIVSSIKLKNLANEQSMLKDKHSLELTLNEKKTQLLLESLVCISEVLVPALDNYMKAMTIMI